MNRDHPRIRGEHREICDYTRHRRGSPPHTRGTPMATAINSFFIGITPAYAGNTSSGLQDLRCIWDHPRIRGEHRAGCLYYAAGRGSPPHTRGTQGKMHGKKKFSRITPAYAGNTRKDARQEKIQQDHPRIRGEHKCDRKEIEL